ADNLFHRDPYYRQGGDMVRVGGLTYAIDPTKPIGRRITEIKIAGRPLVESRRYKAASWASPGAEAAGPPAFDVVAAHLRKLGRIKLDPSPRGRVLKRTDRVCPNNPRIAAATHSPTQGVRNRTSVMWTTPPPTITQPEGATVIGRVAPGGGAGRGSRSGTPESCAALAERRFRRAGDGGAAPGPPPGTGPDRLAPSP